MVDIWDSSGILERPYTMDSLKKEGKMVTEFKQIQKTDRMNVFGGVLFVMARKLDIFNLFHKNYNTMVHQSIATSMDKEC